VVQDGYEGDSLMALTDKEFNNDNHSYELIEKLEKDRAWILEELDKGAWPDLRVELASLERELGQILIRAKEQLDDSIKGK
tara:strand:+ start:2707 stop:2949 length:243 start_codon:yes stop_codon:yes gene_type:complete